MLQVEGLVRLVPLKVACDAGSLKVDETQNEPAVLQTLVTGAGLFQVVYPSSSIGGVVKMLQETKKESEKDISVSDLYIPSNEGEIEAMKKAQDALRKSK